MMEFSVGEKVRFNPPGRGEMVGVLVKYNRKTVTIVTDAGERWNVSPHLLTTAQKPANGGRVIDV